MQGAGSSQAASLSGSLVKWEVLGLCLAKAAGSILQLPLQEELQSPTAAAAPVSSPILTGGSWEASHSGLV